MDREEEEGSSNVENKNVPPYPYSYLPSNTKTHQFKFSGEFFIIFLEDGSCGNSDTRFGI